MNPARFDPLKDDVALLAALHQSAFADAWDAAAITALLTGPGVFAFFAEDGFVLARAAGGEAEILTLAVAPRGRRRGLGRLLVLKTANEAQNLQARALFLEVAEDNAAARGLYAGLGLRPVGRRKAYYAGTDAVLLRGQLPLSRAGEFA